MKSPKTIFKKVTGILSLLLLLPPLFSTAQDHVIKTKDGWVVGVDTFVVMESQPEGAMTITAKNPKEETGTSSLPCSITSLNISRTGTSTCNATPCDGSMTVTGVNGTGLSGTYTYTWSNGQTGPTSTGLCAGNITVTVRDNSGPCTYTLTTFVPKKNASSKYPLKDTLRFTLWTLYTHADPPGTPGRQFWICTGECVQLWAGNGKDYTQVGIIDTTTGGYPLTYQWSGNTPGAADSAGKWTACPTTPTTYCVTVTDQACVSASVCSTPQIRPIPILLTTGVVDATCANKCDGRVTVNASGASSPYTYLWTNGITTPTTSALCKGPYTVTVTDKWECSSTAQGTVNGPAAIVPVMNNTNPACGATNGTATLNLSGGTTPYTYSWSPSGGTSTVATGLSAGTYTVSITDKNGCTETASVTLSTTTGPAVTASATPAACGATNGTTSATVTGGTSPYTYSWTTAPPQTTVTATGLSGGSYTVTVTDASGCTQLATATVGSGSPPTAALNGTTNILCAGANNGSATASGGGGTSPYTYSWNTTPPQSTTTATGLSPGTYTVTVTDISGCTATVPATISEPTPLVLATTPVNEICGNANGSASVNASGATPAYTYLWNTVPPQSTANATGLSGGTYTVTVTDLNGCTRTASAVVGSSGTATVALTGSTNVLCANGNDGTATANGTTGTAPYTYQWMTTPNQNSATATGLSAGTYTVTMTDANGCKHSTTVLITQPTPVVLTTTAANASCGGSNGSVTVNSSGGTPGYTYAWNTVPPQTTTTATGLSQGTYTVIVSDVNGCTKTATASVASSPGPTAVFSGGTACEGSPISFTNNSTPGTTTFWDYGDGTTGTSNNPHTYAAPGTYTVKLVVTDANGCKDSTTTSVTVNPIPVVIFSDTASGCAPLTVTFVNASTPASGVTYFWRLGDGSTSTSANPTHTYTQPGTYSVTLIVTATGGCVDSLTRPNIITVYGYPTANFTMNPQETEILAPTINFFDQSTGAVLWKWTFGDGDSSTDVNPIHVYQDTGTYTVCLYIENQNECPSTICQNVVIKPIWTFYIPNVFTPDGDGKNEGFIGKGYNISEHQMWIFDRWGDLVYTTGQTRDPASAIPWNGRANNGGSEAQEDVFVYIVIIKDVFSKKHRYVGSVSLIR